MSIGKLIVRNTLRSRRRSLLTVVGITIALLAFSFIHTMVNAWYYGVKTSAKDRLVTRNRVSLTFHLPISYAQRIAQVPGVASLGYANWFGGIYQRDEKYRFAQFAVDDNYVGIYPEYVLEPAELEAWRAERRGALVGQEIAERFGLKVGDVMQIQGTIYEGIWEFVISGILKPRDPGFKTRVFLFHWDYLNERNRILQSRPPDHTGIFVMQLTAGADAAKVASSVDELFANSFAETLTESETAFRQGFVSMSATILTALRVISLVVIGIMLLVLSNTMLMAVRERYREYSILKALGFEPRHLTVLIFGEAFLLTATGFVTLCVLLAVIFSLPPRAILGDLVDFFPSFELSPLAVIYSFIASVFIGLLAGLVPVRTVRRLKVTEGLRRLD